jgi:hypothetical protein
MRTLRTPADVVICAPDRDTLRVRLEELAELWLGNRFIGDADVFVVLNALRPDLWSGEAWALWTDYTDAHAEWRAATGWAENLRLAAVKACDELIGDRVAVAGRPT